MEDWGEVSVTVGAAFDVAAGPPIDTFDRTAVVPTDRLWLATANPTSTGWANCSFAEATGDQVTPSTEEEAVKGLPRRSSFSHAGAPPDRGLAWFVPAFADLRERNTTPLPALANT